MGAAAAPVAGGLSLASAGFGLMASSKQAQAQEMEGEGKKAAAEAQAARLERAAEYGKVAAAQTDAGLREELNTTLANIDAIRAAAHTDPTSPTGIAIKEHEAYVSDRARNTKVSNILAQAAQDEADANFLHQSGAYALQTSKVGADATRLGGYAKALGSAGPGLIKSFG